jgi:hypothetical protein
MQRLLSTFVLFAIGWGVFYPTALNTVGNVTQACCRRNGKHHCMSGAAGVVAETTGASLSAAFPACPHHSHSSLLAGAARLESNPSLVLHLPTARLLSLREVLFPGSRGKIRHSERGPPALLYI